MFEGKIVGIRNVKYKSKKTGADVEGIQLNITYPASSKETKGQEVGTIYVSATSPEYDEVFGLVLGEYVRFVTSFQFGRYSNVYVGKVKK